MAVIPVEMGETQISSRQGDRLLAIGLGASVGVCLFDPTAGIAAMVHIVLPKTPSLPPPMPGRRAVVQLPGKCADTAIPNILAAVEKAGASLMRVKAAIVGGAQIFSPNPASGQNGSAMSARLEIGPRNVEAVKRGLAQARIPIVAEMTGGYCGRTVTFHVTLGQVCVRPIGAEERVLVTLSERHTPGAETLGKEGILRG